MSQGFPEAHTFPKQDTTFSPFDLIHNTSFLEGQGFTGTELKSSTANQAPFYCSSYIPLLHQLPKKPYYNTPVQCSNLKGHLFLYQCSQKNVCCYIFCSFFAQSGTGHFPFAMRPAWCLGTDLHEEPQDLGCGSSELLRGRRFRVQPEP